MRAVRVLRRAIDRSSVASGDSDPDLRSSPDALRLCLPAEYVAGPGSTSVAPASTSSGRVPRPDVHAMAAHLAGRYGSRRIIDLEDGSAPCPPSVAAGSIVVCDGVIERLRDPRALLNLLRDLTDHADAILVSTVDRQQVSGSDALGPPADASHVREWEIHEFDRLLRSFGLSPSFIGFTADDDRGSAKGTILAIIDRRLAMLTEPPDSFRVEALYACFNERDIVIQTICHLLREGVDVTVIDDWSTDGTWELVGQTFDGDERVRRLRHRAQPSALLDHVSLLDLKEQLGRASSADWLIHHDADEVRVSPWRGVSLRTALWNVQRMGFNAVDHAVIDFRPEREGFSERHDPLAFFGAFEWGRRPGHFVQVKAWRNQRQAVGLAAGGGHRVEFDGLRIFPYKFLLRHYPLRSSIQAQQKVFRDRIPRYSAAERAMGWHIQYDAHDPAASDWLTWADLVRWNSGFDTEFLTERLASIGLDR